MESNEFKNAPFTAEIIKILECDFNNSLALCNKELLLQNMSWISKFAFDKDYLSFKYKIETTTEEDKNRNSSLSTLGVLQKYRDTFNSQNGCEVFSNKFPLLKDLLNDYVKSIDSFISSIKKHYQKDKKELSRELFSMNPLGEIKSIDLGQGDTHQYGKSTAIVHLTCGRKIVYKPRSGELDLAFNALLETINSQNIEINLKTAKICNHNDYFWMMYIDHLPCNSKDDIKDYYLNAGALLAIIYLLRGTDVHHENIIANGKNPIIIDTECLFNFNERDEYSIFHTSLLPFYSYHDENNNYWDNSGLGANGKQITSLTDWGWENINTDAMEVKRKGGYMQAKNNQPIFESNQIPPTLYLNKIIDGFTTICRWIIENRESFHTSNPFDVFKNKQIRILLRATKPYRQILENSFVPKALQSKTERQSLIEKNLNEFPLLFSLNNNERACVIKHEFDAIDRMDIPFFTVNTTEKYLKESDKIVIANYYSTSPFDYVINKIKALDQDKINSDIRAIISAFAARYDLPNIQVSKIDHPKMDISIDEELEKISNKLCESAFAINGSYFWNSFTCADNKKPLFDIIGDDIYSGNLGIAIFFSSLSKYNKTKKYNQIIDSIILQQFEKFSKDRTNSGIVNISFNTGIAGAIYALLKIDSSKYKNKITELIELISPESIYNDNALDVLNGAAGCLAVLVEVYKKNVSDIVLEKIALIANYLLEKRTIDKTTGYKIWITNEEKLALTGFAHGVSGIAYSLLKAYEVTNNESYKTAFYEALDYEDYFFVTKHNNWRDLRNNKDSFQNMWCYGAAGIGLCRVDAYNILKDKRFLNDIKRAIKSVKDFQIQEMDIFCCGNIGRLDFLLEASKVLKDKKLHSFTKQKIEDLISQRANEGNYKTFYNPHITLENPSLFRGLSGIGYTYLRAIDPLTFPSISLLQ